MITAIWFIIAFVVLTLISLLYYFYVEYPKMMEKQKSNVIHLQTDGFDFILYQGKIRELISDYQRYSANMDLIVYSKSLFIGFLNPKHAYVDLPAKAIQSIKYESTKLTLHCLKEISGTSKIIIKSNSTQQLFHIAKKLDFILRRSKKVKAM